MAQENFDYDVRCKTCFEKFTTQLFDSHEKNLWLVDNKSWYCPSCKETYFQEQTSKLAKSHAQGGFSTLEGTPKRVSWAEKIRAELINKVNYLRQSLVFGDDKAKQTSDLAFDQFLKKWQEISEAKWWVDNRKMTVRDISDEIKEITKSLN